ncbi:MAG: GatB/YqeY domain-containing protein [Anaerolineae bacterium]
MTALEQRINQDYMEAMRAGDALRKETLRFLRAAIKSAQIDKRAPLTEEEIWEIIKRQVKQRRESIEQFRKGNREDLAAKEEAELAIIESYLPAQLSRQEIEVLARQVIVEVGAAGPRDRGKVMGKLMPQVKGRADGRLVNEVVRELLGA